MHHQKELLAIVLTISLTMLPACATSTNTYQQISQEEAKTLMTDTAIILDVRTNDEYNSGHIPDAICIPNEDIETREDVSKLLPDKNQTILVYCRSGNRSKQAAQKLADMGYTNVFEFGGIRDWSGDVTTNQ